MTDARAAAPPSASFPSPRPTLRDDALGMVLRPWRDGDAAALVAAWADPAIAAHCGVPADAGPERAVAWISRWQERADRGLALDLVVADAQTDAVLGEVGLWPFRAPPDLAAVAGVLELGWWTGAAHRSRGLAGASVRLLADWALTTLGPRSLVARIPADHTPSEAVARCAGLAARGPISGGHTLWRRPAATMHA